MPSGPGPVRQWGQITIQERDVDGEGGFQRNRALTPLTFWPEKVRPSSTNAERIVPSARLQVLRVQRRIKVAQGLAAGDNLMMSPLAFKAEQLDQHAHGLFRGAVLRRLRQGQSSRQVRTIPHVACSPYNCNRACTIQASGTGIRRHDSMRSTASAAAYQSPARVSKARRAAAASRRYSAVMTSLRSMTSRLFSKMSSCIEEVIGLHQQCASVRFYRCGQKRRHLPRV